MSIIRELHIRYILLLITSICLFGTATDAQAAHPALSGGEGTKESPYQIASAQDLVALSKHVNAGGAINNTCLYYEVTEDIDMAGTDFTPICNDAYIYPLLMMSLEGNNHTISNLKVAEGNAYCGLFGYLEAKGTDCYIRNLHIADMAIDINTGEPNVYAGGLVGYLKVSTKGSMTIANCTTTGRISLESYTSPSIGGLCGQAITLTNAKAITISNCTNYADIDVADGPMTKIENLGIGGIAGYLEQGTISQCSNHGNVTGPSAIGGIAGQLYCSAITKSNNSGRITFFSDYAAGITGFVNTSAIDFCTNIGPVAISFASEADKRTSKTKYIGGIVGYSYVGRTIYDVSPIADNLNAGYIAGWDYTGGICGYPLCYTYNNVNIAPVFDAKPYISDCKSGANNATYPFDKLKNIADDRKNWHYGGALYDKQMSILTDSMNGMVFTDRIDGTLTDIAKMAELYTSQMLNDSIYKHFCNLRELEVPHYGNYDWVYNAGLYAVPNETDADFNVLASLVMTLDTADRVNNVNHKFSLLTLPTEEGSLRIESASKDKICKIAGTSVGLVGKGNDTLRIYYKGLVREIPLVINSVDTLMFSGGAGTENNPYLISCVKDLRELEYIVKNYTSEDIAEHNWSYDKHFKVTTHIDSAFAGTIGENGAAGKTFQGDFDGNGKRITLNKTEGICALFAATTHPCAIRNLEVNGSIGSCTLGAGIVAIAESTTIDSCLSAVNIWVSDTAGGIACIAKDCRISNCGNNGLVKSSLLSGGIAGYSKNCQVENVVNGGTVLSKQTAGGLLGSTPGTTIKTGVNYGYTGRTTQEIEGTRIGYTIGDPGTGTEVNTYWNAQTNTIWDETWETEGLSTQQMLTDATLKEKLGKDWETASATTLPTPKALKKFPGTILLNMPYSFENEWNTLKDLNQPFKIPGEQFVNEGSSTNLEINAGKKGSAQLDGTISPLKFGADTLEITYYYSGLQNMENHYKKIVPYFVTKGYAGGGDGTAESPYLINNANDLLQLQKDVRNDFYCVDTLRNASWHKHFRQTADIAYSAPEPIGGWKRERYQWNGHYDGNGHSITLDLAAGSHASLFGAIAKGAIVKNVTTKGKVTGTDYCGAIAGQALSNSLIENCKNKAEIEGTNYVGGLVGRLQGARTSNCINGARVTGTNYTGGIAGYTGTQASIADALNTGHIEGTNYTGGITGVADSCDVRRAVNAGLTEGKKTLGGIAGLYAWNGQSGNLIYQCMNYGFVDKEAENAGAIVGESKNNQGTNVAASFYNNQLTLAKAINGVENEGFSSGLPTAELVGDNLYNKLDDNWVTEKGHYPMPASLQGDEADIAKSPTNLAMDEHYANIVSEFTVQTDAGAEWASKLGKIKIEGNQASFAGSGIDTLTTSKNGATIEQPVFIANGLFSGGNGKKETPYRLTCKQDFEELALYVNTNMLETDEDKNWSDGLHFSLENDIPEDSAITTTIGIPDTEYDNRKIHFGGTFNGNGHKLKVDIKSDKTNVGLFGYLNKANVSSLSLYGKVSGTSNVGGLAGYSEKSAITACQNAATVTGNNDAGGICGYSSETSIEKCNNAGNILSIENKAGGITAEANSCAINGCVNTAMIAAYTNNSYTGGICGRISRETKVTNCLNSGIITGENKAGGIVGEANTGSALANCIVTNDLDYAGRATIKNKGFACGLADETSSITNCFVDNQLNLQQEAADKDLVNSKATKELTGDKLSSALPESWIFEENMYPRPNNDTIALLGASAIVLEDGTTRNIIDTDFEAYTFGKCGWRTQIPRIAIEGNDAKLLQIGADTLTVYHEILERKIAVNVTCVTKHNEQTVSGCDVVEYEGAEYTKDTTFVEKTKSQETGCDSIVTLKIVVNHSAKAPEQPIVYATKDTVVMGVLCKNDTTLLIIEETAKGCDSIIAITVDMAKATIENNTLEAGCDSTLFGGKWYKRDTTIVEHYKDAQDRDTLIRQTTIPVNHSVEYTADTLAGYDSLLVEGKWYKKDTVITNSLQKENTGCDSIVHTPIAVGKTVRDTLNKFFCGDETHYLLLSNDEKVEVKDGMAVMDTTLKTKELLKITKYNITVKQPQNTYIVHTGCDYVDYDEVRYTENDTITDTISTAWCDSMVHHVIKVKKPTMRHDTLKGCNTLTFDGQEYARDTVIYNTLDEANSQGCDSIAATHLVVFRPGRDTLHTYGLEEKEVYGTLVKNDTTLNDTLRNHMGCDSLFRAIVVHITHFRIDTVTEFACDSFFYQGQWQKNDVMLESNENNPFRAWDDLDQKYQTFPSNKKLIHVIIGKKQEYHAYIDSCDQITYKNTVYTQDTVLTETHLTQSNCDSIVYTHLRLHQPQAEKDTTINGCESVTWNGLTYTTNAFFSETVKTKYGCDSTINVRIYISHPDTVSPEIRTGCGQVEYEGETFTADTTIVRIYTNQGGCDSIMTTHIVVHQPNDTLVTLEGEYDVVYNGRKYTRSTVFRDTLTNRFGCDSIVTVAIIVTKGLDYPLIVNKYDYMLLCNNNIGSDRYASYQWYKNGKPLSGETKAYMSETEGQKLAGCYQVYVKTTKGEEYFSEEICIEKAKELIVYPNPVGQGEAISIDYDFTDQQKNGLYYDVYNSSGKKVYSGKPDEYPIEIPGLRDKGYYFVLITTGEDKNLSTKFIVK